MYGLKKKWSGFVVILLTFFTILPAYAVPGVMIYNADQAAPTGFVRLVDDIAAPTQMIFMQVNPTATGFSYQL